MNDDFVELQVYTTLWNFAQSKYAQWFQKYTLRKIWITLAYRQAHMGQMRPWRCTTTGKSEPNWYKSDKFLTHELTYYIAQHQIQTYQQNF